MSSVGGVRSEAIGEGEGGNGRDNGDMGVRLPFSEAGS